jgi:hypothetical protein
MTFPTAPTHVLQSARDILQDVCDLREASDALKSRARCTLLQLQPGHDAKRAGTHAGLTWWLQLEPTGKRASEAVAALSERRHPKVWTAIAQSRTAVGKSCTEALVCFAGDERVMRDAFAQRFGTHAANAATVFPGILINEVTASVITAEALRMVETLIERREPFSLEARLEYVRR